MVIIYLHYAPKSYTNWCCCAAAYNSRFPNSKQLVFAQQHTSHVFITNLPFLFPVFLWVHSKSISMYEVVCTHRTCVGSPVCVSPYMYCRSTWNSKGHVTHSALVWYISCMNPHMIFQCTRSTDIPYLDMTYPYVSFQCIRSNDRYRIPLMYESFCGISMHQLCWCPYYAKGKKGKYKAKRRHNEEYKTNSLCYLYRYIFLLDTTFSTSR